MLGFKVGAILAFISAVVWFVVAGGMAGYRMHRKANCEKVTAVVVGYETNNNRDSREEMPQSLYTVFQYEVPHTKESKTGKSSGASYPPAYSVGDKIGILVHPDNPEEAMIDTYSELYLLPTILSFLGIFMLVVGFVFVYMFRRLSRGTL